MWYTIQKWPVRRSLSKQPEPAAAKSHKPNDNCGWYLVELAVAIHVSAEEKLDSSISVMLLWGSK